MSVPVTVPAVGESITSGVLSAWHRKDGEQVAVGDLLFTLDTDKVSSEVTAQEPGILKIKVAEGQRLRSAKLSGKSIRRPGRSPRRKRKK